MKARINYKSRQTIIIMSIAVVLLIAAITGTVAFVKGNRNVAAAMKNENRQAVENSEDNSKTNTSIADNGNLNNNETENKNNGKVLSNTGDNANPIDIGQNGNNGENNGATIENDGNTSTSTTTGETNVPNQEYTQTTVIPGRENVLVEQNTEIGWSPISIKAFDIATKLKVHVNKFPDISTIKTSEGKHKDGTPVTKENPLHELDTITYTLAVENIGNGKGTVKISDTVPEGTTLVTDSIKCGENTYTEAELNAGIEVLLEGGEEKYVTFTVTINPFEDEKITVRNAEAKQDENPVPPTDDEVVKEYVSIDVNKEFIDKENVEELRPTDVVVALYERENDETYIDTRTLNEQNGWKESFTGLDKYDFKTKELIDYDVRELNVDENYTASYDKNQEQNNITLKITNTLKYKNISTSVTVNKIWIDPENVVRPEVTINLYQNGSDDVFASYTLKNGETSHEFTNLPKYDDDGNEYVYTAEEAEVNGYTAEYSNDTLTITNTIDQENTVSISGTKTWVDPEGTELVHPDITINLLKNGIKDKTIKLTNGNTKYTFTGLPKYQVNEDGSYILDNNGNVQLNQYRVEEEVVQNYETSYDGYNITNTFKQDIQGTVEITTTTTSETSVKTPLDVVFVLDISGSMNDNDKDKTMVDSVNSAISTIMQENPDSRVGVVAYSSKENSNYSNNSNAITLLPLGKYTPKSDGKYLTIKDDTYTITWRDEWGIPQSATYDKDIISTNVNEVASISLNVYGGTYTQTGIKAGADILTSASTKYTTKVNGKDKEVTCTPVIILLSDGDPTYYNKNYQSLTGDRSGTGNSTSENDAYYTIRTADYYKKQVTSHYYGTTGTKSKFYTIGLNMSGTLSKTILDPSADNLNECNKNGGNSRNRNVMGKLYDKIISDGSVDKYSYADKSYVGSMTASDLQGIFNTIINGSTTSTDTRDITLEESNNRRVDLEGIDTSKAFRLIIGSTSYNFAQAKASGYVKGNNTDGYYVDLSKVAKGSTITISYNK